MSPLSRNVALRRTELKAKRRKSDVPDWLFGYLVARDKECKAPALGATDPCFGRLTIEHVKFESAIGKRAPSDKFHTLLLCLGHNTGWALLSASKEAERQYLQRVEPRCYSDCGCAGARDSAECQFDPSCERCAA